VGDAVGDLLVLRVTAQYLTDAKGFLRRRLGMDQRAGQLHELSGPGVFRMLLAHSPDSAGNEERSRRHDIRHRAEVLLPSRAIKRLDLPSVADWLQLALPWRR